MKKYWFLVQEIARGKSILRAYMNFHLRALTLAGDTIDIGGGAAGTDAYLPVMHKSADYSFHSLDLKIGSTIDFEKDPLPIETDRYDTVLFLNVMEHIYNFQHIANEVMRITKSDGQLIGYVPFLMWYHPDHSDFFRYTHEALRKIFSTAGATEVTITPNNCGPFIAGAQMYLLSFPRLARPVLFTLAYLLDELFFLFRDHTKTRYKLGYIFVGTKR